MHRFAKVPVPSTRPSLGLPYYDVESENESEREILTGNVRGRVEIVTVLLTDLLVKLVWKSPAHMWRISSSSSHSLIYCS